MSDSRRDFLKGASAGLLVTATGCHREPPPAPAPAPAASPASPVVPAEAPAGMPPAFGTAPAVGPRVSEITFLESSRLVQVTMPLDDRELAASNWRSAMAPLLERRTGPRKVALPSAIVPYSIADPVHASGAPALVLRNQFVRSGDTNTPLPADDASIAFAPVHQLSRWIEHRHLTSERLTAIYLDRIARFDPKLRCIITLTREHALEQARAADKEIARGHYRGPLHGIPWGAKDLLDTAGIRTTWGAEPYRNRVPATDAIVTQRLNAAGAVLIAKLSLGALALNDVWFGGQTMNPWLLEEGSSGSSAGPGAATAAGLVGFAIGSETGGSIVSPSMRCGVTGLRPTFGRVARTGAMTLCWSLDKLGPMARSVEDTLLVLNTITGPDPTDPSSVPSHLDFNATAPVKGLRVGYFPQWMHEAPATDVDRHALDVVRELGMVPVEVALPDWPYDSLQLILFAEAAAAFEDLTASGHDHDLRMQVADAWPNSFRQARFLSAVDLVQADRLRRKVALEMARLFAGTPSKGLPNPNSVLSTGSQNPNSVIASGAHPPNSVIPTEAKRSGGTRFTPATNAPANSGVDLLLVPSLRDEMLTITNFTGHPSLTLRAGFVTVSQARSDWAPDPNHPLPTFNPPRRVPHGITLIGRLFDEGTIARAGLALERAFNVAGERPPRF